MTGRTHLLVGIAVGLLVAVPYSDPGLVAAAALAGAVGGLLPDIDHPRSIISGYVPGSGILRLAISHRGPTHTLLFVGMIAALLLVAAAPLALTIAFIAGMSLHLVCDMATPSGVRLLYPVFRSSWRIAPRGLLWATAWFFEAGTMVTAVALIVGAVIARL